MLRRLAYLITGSALLLLAAATFWCVNHLNALTLTQQQTQRQITQWRDQPQHNNDYHELQAAIKNITGRTETLTRRLNDVTNAQVEQLQSINGQIKALEGQVQTLSTSYQHLQQQTAMRSRAKAKSPVPSPLWTAKTPFFLINSEFRTGRQFAVIAPSGYHSLSQLQLVAPGDSVQGWQLLQLDGSHATFHRGGQRLTLDAGG